MDRNPSYVLIVDGGNYCSTQDSLIHNSHKLGDFVDAVKVIAELERIIGTKFTTKFYFQGTQSSKPNEFHRLLAQPPPHGPHFNVEIFGKKRQWGLNSNNVKTEIYVEEGVDVAVATKIIECAYGIGKEEQSEKIVVITGDGDMVKAIECADAKRRNTVHVVSAKQSLSASLNRYVLIDPETSCAVYLDDLMSRCISNRNQPSDGTFSEPYDSFKKPAPPSSFPSSFPSSEIIPTGNIPNNGNSSFFNNNNNSGYSSGSNPQHGGRHARPPHNNNNNRNDRNRRGGGRGNSNYRDAPPQSFNVNSTSQNGGFANSNTNNNKDDLNGFQNVSKLKRKLINQVENANEQISDVDDEDDDFDFAKFNHPNNKTTTSIGGSGYVPKASAPSSDNLCIDESDYDSASDINYNTDTDVEVSNNTGHFHLSKTQRKKLRRKAKKAAQQAAAISASLGPPVAYMKPISGDRVVDLSEHDGIASLAINHSIGKGYVKGDIISIDD